MCLGTKKRDFCCTVGVYWGGITVEKSIDALFDDRMVAGRSLNKDVLLQPNKRENIPVRTYIPKYMTLVKGEEPFQIMDDVVTRKKFMNIPLINLV